MFQSLEGIKEDRDSSLLICLALPSMRFQSLEGIKEDRDWEIPRGYAVLEAFQSLEGIKEDRDLAVWGILTNSGGFSPWKGLRKIATSCSSI